MLIPLTIKILLLFTLYMLPAQAMSTPTFTWQREKTNNDTIIFTTHLSMQSPLMLKAQLPSDQNNPYTSLCMHPSEIIDIEQQENQISCIINLEKIKTRQLQRYSALEEQNELLTQMIGPAMKKNSLSSLPRLYLSIPEKVAHALHEENKRLIELNTIQAFELSKLRKDKINVQQPANQLRQLVAKKNDDLIREKNKLAEKLANAEQLNTTLMQENATLKQHNKQLYYRSFIAILWGLFLSGSFVYHYYTYHA